ncbi:hypothetical protein [Lactobacillus sp. UCMA15818]|uniref:hypothetical protein n=1 Tax=Lactobacillus sp. UCMA15818 TaxID=2583394 RepID=UPI0025AF7189|nr:hypothetical protein [Lactobacillus sp. UCMA15818]MDN2454380.1 hypothetical protein [Lactobacillus sp. UCMA15818]
MKKVKLISIITVLSLYLGLTGTAAVDADTTTSTVGATVTKGDITINSVPNLSFSTSVADVANNSSTTASLTTDGTVSTSDNQGYGTDTSWTLAATPTTLSYTDADSNTHTLGVSSLKIAGNSITTIDGETATQVATGTNEGDTSTALTADNTAITLGQNNQVFGGSYTGTITWTLTGNNGGDSSTSDAAE